MHGVAHEDVELVPVLRQQLELERLGDLVRRDPRLGVRLEAAHQQPADLLLEIGVAVRVAQRRRAPVEPADRLGDDVVVLGRLERDGHADLLSERFGPLAAAVDDVLTFDVAAGGGHGRDPAAIDGAAVGLCSLQNPHSAAPGAPGQCLGQVSGVGLGVVRQPDRAGQVPGAHQRPPLARLGHRDVMRLQALRARQVDGPAKLRQPVGGRRDPERAALAPAGPEADLGLQARVEPAAVEHQLGQRRVRAELADDAGRVPGRSARELSLLE